MIKRPAEADGVRLYYNLTPKFNPEKFDRFGEINILIMTRLYRYFSAMNSTVTMMPKDALVLSVFEGDPRFSKTQVGRILENSVPFKLGFQENSRKSNGYRGTMWWRWQHPKEIVFGLEYFMIGTWLVQWLRSLDEEVTEESIEAELEVIRDLSVEEELEMIREMSGGRLHSFLMDPKKRPPQFTGETETVMDEDTGEEWTIPKKKWTQ